MKAMPQKSVTAPGQPLRHQLERKSQKDVGDSTVHGMWLDISLTKEVGTSEGSKFCQGTSPLNMPRLVQDDRTIPNFTREEATQWFKD